MDRRFVTTTNDISGYRVVEHLGVARGLTVRSSNIVGGFEASIKSLIGGRIENYITFCESAREEALTLLCEHADNMGANAILALRYDTNDVIAGTAEVLAYGTAVRLERIR